MSTGEILQDVYMKHKDHGAIGMYMFFKPILIVADLNLVCLVLTTEFPKFHDRGFYSNEKVDPLSGNLLMMPGNKWHDLRIKFTSTFTTAKIKKMFAILNECGQDFTNYLQKEFHSGDTIDISETFAR